MKQPIPLWPKQKASPVTICIGFLTRWGLKSEDHIFLASDSRISVGTNVTNDARKISAIKFKNGHALIAKAGYRHSFNRFEEIFAEKGAATEITGYRTIAGIAEDSIRELQKELLDRNTEDAAQRLQNSYCEFIIAYFHNEKPYLYTLNLISRIAERVDGDFVAIGNGETLANFLLTSVDPKKLKQCQFDMAISVIEMCKLHDSSCGGPCRMGIIGSGIRAPLIIDEANLISISRRMNFTKRAHAALLRNFADKFKNASPWDASMLVEGVKNRPQK